MEIPKAYIPKNYEDAIYKEWESSGFFNPDKLPPDYKEKYSIMMPPPNVTGVLHLGHALENALMDAMIRYQRLQGKKALLLPGTDHAAVATQARVEKDLIKSGKYKNPRQELGREKLLEIIRSYAENSKQHIIKQIKKMGTSCDWDRLAYTFDENRSKAVNELFIKMYEDGLIYRGFRTVNWSVAGQSTCSDDELVYVERPAKMYTFRYSSDFPFAIATTRPETKLGDTAVAVNPKDSRYKKFIGKTFTIDVGAKNPLKIKIIAEDSVDMKLGTGALGVTPAHSQIDYTMYESRKGSAEEIGIIQVIGSDGKMTENAGKNYAGLPVEEARKKFINYLKKQKLLEKEEEIVQNVGTSDRFDDIVEVIPMTQWFVNVNKTIPAKNKSLKDLMSDAVTLGHKENAKQKINITPERFQKTYLGWIENLHDWCISRQIWWGHRIPAWYQGGEIKVCATCPGAGWTQDTDTLDTWFSSGAWTFSTLGWPQSKDDLKKFHPTSWMQMGYELLFFWMARMILMSTYALDEIPFKNVYIHGILRDEQGRKFSKSLGNGIDPIDISDKYGTDALRLSLLLGNTPGNDMRFFEDKVEHWRNTVNKLWNISRFILTNSAKISVGEKKPQTSSLADEWILSEFNDLIADATEDFEKYNFSSAGEKIYDFTWNKLADWYLEIAKIEKNKDDILLHILSKLLKLWHPFAPFVTEVIWKNFDEKKPLLIEKWPQPEKNSFSKQKMDQFIQLQNIIIKIRNLKAEAKISVNQKIDIQICGINEKQAKSQQKIIEQLAKCQLVFGKSKPQSEYLQAIEAGLEIYLPVSKDAKQKIEQERQKLQKYLSNLEKKLSNKNFLEKAPPEIIQAEQEKLKQTQEKLSKY